MITKLKKNTKRDRKKYEKWKMKIILIWTKHGNAF